MNLFAVFIEGLLSFLSPCVLPLVPLYMSYLSKGAKEVNEEGEVVYRTKNVFLTTIFFVLGICTTFFILGLSLSFVKEYIQDYAEVIGLIGGCILIVVAFYEMGWIDIKAFNKTVKMDVNVSSDKMSFLKSYLIGFIFSFGWSPCIGPMLTNVLIMAATSDALLGNLYLVVYAAGLIIPFLLLGLFTRQGLEFLKKHKDAFKMTMKIAGIIILIFGVNMLYQNAKDIVNLKNSSNTVVSNDPRYMSFIDQNGNSVRLADYEGEYLMVNYITTWCDYCKISIPMYQEFLKENNIQGIYVMSPSINQGDKAQIIAFAKEYDIEVPILIDETNILFTMYNVSSYPTLNIFGPDSSYIGYVSGALDVEQLSYVYDQAVERYENK